MADRSVVAFGTNYSAQTTYFTTKALADYRRSRFSDAADLAQKVLSSRFSSSGGTVEVEAGSIMAMSRQKLNQTESARTALLKAKAVAEKNLAMLPNGDLGKYWGEWIIAQAMLREATQIIEGTAATSTATK
jgi:hypothetical protein